jgi:hypothetical protein
VELVNTIMSLWPAEMYSVQALTIYSFTVNLLNNMLNLEMITRHV